MHNPWLELKQGDQPYVLDIDREAVLKFQQKTKKPELRLVLDVAPEPWCGPVDSAGVLVLSGNPHWDERDSSLPKTVHERMWENLRGDRPIYLLDHDLIGTTGANWYRSRLLKNVLEHVADVEVARRLALLDFVGYRSHKWDKSLRVPSQGFARKIVEDAMSRDAVILLTRGVKAWTELAPQLSRYPLCYRNGSAQTVRISPNNTGTIGFENIVAKLGG